MDTSKRIWLLGYISFLATFLASLLFPGISVTAYRLSIASLITSQCIVIYLGHLSQIRSLPELVTKLRNEETFYHLSMCIPLFLSANLHHFLLLPFVIFSSYHVISTLKDYLKPLPAQLDRLHTLMKREQPKMLMIATYLEIASIPYLLFKFIRKQAGLGMLFSSVQFVRHQYGINRRTQIAFHQIRLFTDGIVTNSKFTNTIPIPLKQIYLKSVRIVERLAPTITCTPPKQK